MILDRDAFIRANTRVLTPPHTPEIKLWLADEVVDIWRQTEEDLAQMGLPPPFWAFAWAGGQALARYLLDHPEIVRGRRILDVASGSGLVAIAAMRAGAASAKAVDIDAFAVHAARLNADLNAVALDAVLSDPIGAPCDAEIVLVGDLFYERDLAARLFAWLETLEADGKLVLIGDPGRSYLPKDKLESVAEYQVPVTRALEDSEIKRAWVWRLKPRA